MKKLIIILMLGSLFGDTVVYNDDILMFKRTKTLSDVSFVEVVPVDGKPYIKILISSNILGEKHTWIPCDNILELNDDNGSPIEFECANSKTRLKQAGNHLVQFKDEFYTGFWVSILGNVVTLYGASENKSDIILYGGLTTLAGSIIMLISFDSVGEAGEDLIDAGEKLETEQDTSNP